MTDVWIYCIPILTSGFCAIGWLLIKALRRHSKEG